MTRRPLLKALVSICVGFGAFQAQAELPDAVKKLKPSVLLIGTYSATDNPRFGFRGTGFVVGSGNLAISNAHVLPSVETGDTDKQIAVQVWTESTHWVPRVARIVAVDRQHDLVLLSFEGAAVDPVVLGDAEPSEGSSIAFMGFPIGGLLGFSHVTHRGIVSSIAPMALPAPTSRQLNEGSVRQLRQGTFGVYQLDATAYPGNSGGPIFDPDSGLVLGVINSVLVKGNRESALTHPSGISYGIPIEHVKRLLVGR